MARCLISFGANMGDSLQTLRSAAELLRTRLDCQSDSFRLSRFFRTPPVGGPSGQAPFVNAVVAAETHLSVLEVWQAIRTLEQELGRERNRRWEARRIDLDILLYDDQRIWSPHLKIPHPRMCMRRFILLPAMDVARHWVDPVSGKSIGELAESLQTGAGSLLLIAAENVDARGMLREVAELAMARLVDPYRPEAQDPLWSVRPSTDTRWVAGISPLEIAQRSAYISRAKLCMFIATSACPEGIAWEECHRELAEDLGLVEPAGERLQPPHQGLQAIGNRIEGPRYLLAADDPAWAVHEMVSALQAMDCPIEPIFP